MNELKQTTIETIILFILRELRLERRIKQKDAGHILGINASAFSKVEGGDSQITIEKLFLLCELYRVDPTVLIQQAMDFKSALIALEWHVPPYNQLPVPDELLRRMFDTSLQTAVYPDESVMMKVVYSGGYPTVPGVLERLL